ncbi:MAG: phosphate/phosphite/phosphonate ABC transporter substrate-binding protein [Gammaproteobacteria bacterium]|nr:phosphate/phosphite/phosphonate ABC transporter substrate-binding protein [Gammaproteobacteria bacterium]
MLKMTCIFLLVFLSVQLNAAEKDTLVIGKLVIAGAETKDADIEKKAESIIAEMSDIGISKFEIREFHGISQMVDALSKGQVDWLTSTLFPALIYAEYTHADIFEQKYKSGLPKFYSVFFVRKDSEINSIDHLERRMLMFGNAFSSGSYFAPYYELNERRYTMVNYGAKLDDEVIGKRRIYYKFSYNEEEIVRNLLSGKADIGVMSNFDYDAIPEEKKNQLKIIHNTAAFAQYVEVIRGDLKLSVKKRLKERVKALNAEIEKPVLSVDNEKTTRFYKFVGEGRDGFVYLRSLVEHGIIPVLLDKKEKEKKKNYFY